METKVELITPEMAKEMLRGNTRNRPIQKRHVKILAAEMADNKWALNGTAIVFNGKLLVDGQHRLEACVLSGKPFKSLVVRGVDANAFLTIDMGKKRTAGDTLATQGEKNYTALAAASVIIELYYSADKKDIRFSAKAGGSNRLIAATNKTYPALRNSVEHCVGMRCKLVPVSIMSACHYIFSRIDPILADIFIDKLATGHNIKGGTAMSDLRSRLMDNYTSARKHSRGYILSLIIKAWNAERTGRNIQRLRAWTGDSNDAFPVAV